MGYKVVQIDAVDSAKLFEKYYRHNFYTTKADISGICVKLYTKEKHIKDMWEDNFYAMGNHVKSHARIVAVNDPDRDMEVLYDRSTFTAFLYNFDYYGWIKSIALAVASDMLEDSHRIYSVHGAALDVDGVGVTLVAPSKTGKTTQSWGLLRAPNTSLITDDWYFVRLTPGRPQINGSEKNCYIDADIGDVWEEFKPLVSTTVFDNKGRGIANVRWVTGKDSVVPMTTMRHVILLKRDPSDKEVVRRLTAGEALDYLVEHDFCNPHQMVRDERKLRIRTEFFREFLGKCEVHMVNTITPPMETQDRIREILSESCAVPAP
ncbi:MAG: hypothetical protein GX224_06850 [Thermoplasmatales archaeon]|nr:hypothetical protein [Thermoplasmatales archaeon]